MEEDDKEEEEDTDGDNVDKEDKRIKVSCLKVPTPSPRVVLVVFNTTQRIQQRRAS